MHHLVVLAVDEGQSFAIGVGTSQEQLQNWDLVVLTVSIIFTGNSTQPLPCFVDPQVRTGRVTVCRVVQWDAIGLQQRDALAASPGSNGL